MNIGTEKPTVAVAPIGAYFGKGVNAGKIRNYLVAVYDNLHNLYYPVGRVGVGFKNNERDEINRDLLHSSI